MSQDLAIGIDAGGTSTVALAARRDADAETAVRLGPANASSRGIAAAAAAIVAAAHAAARDRVPAALFVAAAGAGRDDVRDALTAALRAAFDERTRIAVEDDARAALRAAVPEGPGAVLVAGTGSVAYAERGDVRVRVGGAGYLLGDEGSAFAIGLAAVRALARAYDGRARADETTALVARVLAAPDRDALLAATYGAPLDVARVASLAPSIVAFAGKGNRESVRIVQAAARDLGDLVRAAVTAAGLGDDEPAVAFAGGLLRENSMLTFLLETRVGNETPGARIVRSRDEPATAALRFARAMLA